MKPIKSRYGNSRTVKNHGGGCYTVEGESRYYRVAGSPTEISMFDFEGGPCLFVGSEFQLDSSNPNCIIESLIVEKSEKENWAKVTVTVK